MVHSVRWRIYEETVHQDIDSVKGTIREYLGINNRGKPLPTLSPKEQKKVLEPREHHGRGKGPPVSPWLCVFLKDACCLSPYLCLTDCSSPSSPDGLIQVVISMLSFG